MDQPNRTYSCSFLSSDKLNKFSPSLELISHFIYKLFFNFYFCSLVIPLLLENYIDGQMLAKTSVKHLYV